MINSGSVVGLNGGTTTTEVARALATRPDLNSADDGPTLTVVTNALNIANELLVRSRMKIVVAGGVVRPFASAAAIIRFSVPVTVGRSKTTSEPRSRLHSATM